jgi:hypothetical protein
VRRHHRLDAAFVLCLGVLAGCSDEPASGGAPAPSVPSSAQQKPSPSTPSSQSPSPSREFADLTAFGEDRIAAGRYTLVPFGVDPTAPLPVMKVLPRAVHHVWSVPARVNGEGPGRRPRSPEGDDDGRPHTRSTGRTGRALRRGNRALGPRQVSGLLHTLDQQRRRNEYLQSPGQVDRL